MEGIDSFCSPPFLAKHIFVMHAVKSSDCFDKAVRHSLRATDVADCSCPLLLVRSNSSFQIFRRYPAIVVSQSLLRRNVDGDFRILISPASVDIYAHLVEFGVHIGKEFPNAREEQDVGGIG